MVKPVAAHQGMLIHNVTPGRSSSKCKPAVGSMDRGMSARAMSNTPTAITMRKEGCATRTTMAFRQTNVQSAKAVAMTKMMPNMVYPTYCKPPSDSKPTSRCVGGLETCNTILVRIHSNSKLSLSSNERAYPLTRLPFHTVIAARLPVHNCAQTHERSFEFVDHMPSAV